ncbi:hypothetical protein AURDEDRAFT_177847 [Auricularia subglabra TFB-10046 SS5]|uniref:Uncharacterized protein n=1 Tax=Auricularia subglabra (strain TFB-10046 / SS5) TaxID=717982 RepID=J0L9M5_AURST|nr:hypothetical protein AURDEDRAFT_177847 [Auricularia subglabra TFB-10046 SS5]
MFVSSSVLSPSSRGTPAANKPTSYSIHTPDIASRRASPISTLQCLRLARGGGVGAAARVEGDGLHRRPPPSAHSAELLGSRLAIAVNHGTILTPAPKIAFARGSWTRHVPNGVAAPARERCYARTRLPRTARLSAVTVIDGDGMREHESTGAVANALSVGSPSLLPLGMLFLSHTRRGRARLLYGPLPRDVHPAAGILSDWTGAPELGSSGGMDVALAVRTAGPPLLPGQKSPPPPPPREPPRATEVYEGLPAYGLFDSTRRLVKRTLGCSPIVSPSIRYRADRR